MVFSLSSLAVFIRDIYLLGAVFLTAVITASFFTEDWKFINRIKKFIVLFIGIAFIQSIFSPSGERLISIGNFILLTGGGLTKGIRVILRMLIIIVSAAIMRGSSAREIIQALVQCKVPYEIAFMVSLSIRFLPILGEEARDAYTAIQLRGIEIKKLSFKKRIKVYSYLFMPVISGVIFRARDLSISIEARAFRAFPERSSYIQLEMNKIDFLVILISLIFTAVIIYLYFLL